MRSAAEFGEVEARSEGKINELNVIKRIHLMQIICTQDSLSTAHKVNAQKCVYAEYIESIQLKYAHFMLYNLARQYII